MSLESIPDLKGGVMLWMTPFSCLEVKRRGLVVGPQPMEACTMILSQLGVFGWKEVDENLVLASLITGDPLLLIGNHGCAKTHVANKVAQALGRRFLVYDASKAMFEDVLRKGGQSRLGRLRRPRFRYFLRA